jgi:hypothetical protein
VELGALVVTRGGDVTRQTRQGKAFWSATWPVVGKTVVERWIERIRDLGVGMVSVVDRDVQPPARMLEWAKEGVDRILLIVSGSYAEIDLSDFLQFHNQGRNKITRVFDKQGPLGISLLDRRAVLKKASGLGDALHSSRYDFLGYVSRLSSTNAYRQLVQDALEGRCGIQPAGLQADHNLWIDPTAYVDPSAKVEGPCYVGAQSRLNAGVVVAGYSSIERNCEIDLGTRLDHACILPNTYLAPGLHVRNSVVDGTRLEHLDRRVTVDLGPTGLAARRPASGVSISGLQTSGNESAVTWGADPSVSQRFVSEDPAHDS